MNIFFLSWNIDYCVRHHCDKHVVKMIIEYAQQLSTSHRVLDGKKKIVIQNNRRLARYIVDNEKKNVSSILFFELVLFLCKNLFL